jgi:hypothetical protein
VKAKLPVPNQQDTLLPRYRFSLPFKFDYRNVMIVIVYVVSFLPILSLYSSLRTGFQRLCFHKLLTLACTICVRLFVMTFVPAFCVSLLLFSFAFFFCVCLLRLPFASAFCFFLLRLSFASVFCVCLLRLSFASVFCVCLLPCASDICCR